jgi:hypothetical protein
MHIADTTDPTRGLLFRRPNSVSPTIIRLPRGMALDSLPKLGMRKLYSAMERCAKLRKCPLKRGKSKRIFGDGDGTPMYCCAGLQASRTGDIDDQPSYLNDLSCDDWRSLMKMVHWGENCFESIVDYNILSHVRHAREAVPFKTMHAPSAKFHQSKPPAPAKYFGGVAFGCNVYLQCHVDEDFTLSIAQIHLKGKDKYCVDDDIVVYFCLAEDGIAVAMRPGDFVLFDATVPHCISSRCNEADSIMCVSMYLKTAFVGFNNNSIPLSNEQRILATDYQELVN